MDNNFTTKYNRDLALKLAKLTKKVYSSDECKDTYYKSVVKKVDGINVDLQFCILKEKETISIAFKGSKELNDWHTNFSMKEKKLLSTDIAVHGGFESSFKLFLDTVLDAEEKIDSVKIKDIFKEFLSNNSKYKFIITGHSLGGAIATLFAVYLKSKNIDEKRYVAYTFGAPPVGGNDFYNNFKDINLFRIVNQYDPIPKVDKIQKLKHIGVLKELVSDENEYHSSIHYIKNLEKEEKSTLKRKKTNSLKSRVLRYKWITFLTLLVIFSLVFGIWGYMKSGYSILDAIYLSFDLLTLDFVIKKDLNWELEVARFSALVFVSSAMIKAIFHFLGDSFITPILLSRYKNHIVIFGFNGHVKNLLKDINTTEKETKIIIVSSEKVNVHELDIKAQNILYPKELSVRFMKTLALEKASKIVCLEMNDDVDVTHANGVIEYLHDQENTQNIKLYIHLHSVALQDLFNHENYISLATKLPCDIKVFNHYENATKILFRDVAMENYLNNQVTHWLITGEWEQKIAFMRYVAQIAYYGDKQLPRITLLCDNKESSLKQIRTLFPKLEKTVNLYVVDDLVSVTKNSITHVAILYENDIKGLEEALVLNTHFKEQAIFLQQRENIIVANEKITAFGNFQRLNTSKIIFDEELDIDAKKIHNDYIKAVNGEYYVQTWEELAIFKKNSNRMQAEHMAIKYRAIGEKITNTELKRKWAKIEHLRWNAFHYVNGWDYAPLRDDAKKLHNCLVPFEELSKEDQKKDEETLLSLYLRNK